ncbi:MAG: hypothetical protein OEY51_10660, partial [Cyclobacteriaceae bacterium]|nr:hypothetical protein [Cyclobacteriaceae bacterium]
MWNKNRSLLVLVLLAFLSSCNKEEPLPPLTGNVLEYVIYSSSDFSTLGSVKLEEREDHFTKVTVLLNDNVTEEIELGIFEDNGLDGQKSLKSLTPLLSGIESITEVNSLDNGGTFTFDKWQTFDAHIRLSTAQNDFLGFADIGVNALTGNKRDYPVYKTGTQVQQGTATFMERLNEETIMMLKVDGTVAGDRHPAHIHANTISIGGVIKVSLKPIEGLTGISLTNVVKDDGGILIPYSALLDYDGYITVHQSATDMGTFVVQGDIGRNVFTGRSVKYTIPSVSSHGIFGTIEWKERNSGMLNVTVLMSNTVPGIFHPIHVHGNTIAEGGAITISLNDINGNTGKSFTEIDKDNMGNPVTFDDLLNYDGYVNAHYSAANITTFIAQVDIGQNVLTGNKKTYTVEAYDIAGVGGQITFEERKNGETLVTAQLTGTLAGMIHPSHIHINSVAAGGSVLIDLAPVDGNIGKLAVNVSQRNDASIVTYSEIIAMDGHVAFHKSSAEMTVKIAVADIGVNELTNNAIIYTLSAVGASGISGTVEYHERLSGLTLVKVILSGTVLGVNHPVAIYQNN